jgi:hypothetical protein
MWAFTMSIFHVLQVLEGDISTATANLPHWPSDLPPIDGFIYAMIHRAANAFDQSVVFLVSSIRRTTNLLNNSAEGYRRVDLLL